MFFQPSAAVYRRAARLLEQGKSYGVGTAIRSAVDADAELRRDKSAYEKYMQPIREMVRGECQACGALHGLRDIGAALAEVCYGSERDNVRIVLLCFAAAMAETGDQL